MYVAPTSDVDQAQCTKQDLGSQISVLVMSPSVTRTNYTVSQKKTEKFGDKSVNSKPNLQFFFRHKQNVLAAEYVVLA